MTCAGIEKMDTRDFFWMSGIFEKSGGGSGGVNVLVIYNCTMSWQFDGKSVKTDFVHDSMHMYMNTLGKNVGFEGSYTSFDIQRVDPP